jgi:hypothetical protein
MLCAPRLCELAWPPNRVALRGVAYDPDAVRPVLEASPSGERVLVNEIVTENGSPAKNADWLGVTTTRMGESVSWKTWGTGELMVPQCNKG